MDASEKLPESVGAFVDRAFNHNGPIEVSKAQAVEIARWIQETRESALLARVAELERELSSANEERIEKHRACEAATNRAIQAESALAAANARADKAEARIAEALAVPAEKHDGIDYSDDTTARIEQANWMRDRFRAILAPEATR